MKRALTAGFMAFTLLLLGASFKVMASPSLYLGIEYTYERSESYKSIFGGQVALLTPYGFDYLPTYYIAPALLVTGEISPETTATIKRLLERNNRVRTLYLDSPGGDLFAGMNLGALAHQYELTVIVNQYAECESACALAFLGGSRRLILGDTAKFGFHRQYYIIGDKMYYGSWAKDIRTISTYLQRIQSASVSADEIVGTTELVTYSQDRLKERQITTSTKDKTTEFILSHAEQVGITQAEFYGAQCRLVAVEYKCRIDPSDYPVFRAPAVILKIIFNEMGDVNKKSGSAIGDNVWDRSQAEVSGFEKAWPSINNLEDFGPIDCRDPDSFAVFMKRRTDYAISLDPVHTATYRNAEDNVVNWCRSIALAKGSQVPRSTPVNVPTKSITHDNDAPTETAPFLDSQFALWSHDNTAAGAMFVNLKTIEQEGGLLYYEDIVRGIYPTKPGRPHFEAVSRSAINCEKRISALISSRTRDYLTGIPGVGWSAPVGELTWHPIPDDSPSAPNGRNLSDLMCSYISDRQSFDRQFALLNYQNMSTVSRELFDTSEIHNIKRNADGKIVSEEPNEFARAIERINPGFASPQ